uniref:Uncharacterized protein n=1 Tax=Anguilla anguilla TaxID=7936 RepID=A0A0E9R059_ANGAN
MHMNSYTDEGELQRSLDRRAWVGGFKLRDVRGIYSVYCARVGAKVAFIVLPLDIAIMIQRDQLFFAQAWAELWSCL